MPALISCLMPTYNRFPELEWMVAEAVECFLRQDDPNRELIICNDTPGQKLVYNHSKIKIFNLEERLPDLSAKIQFMINMSQGGLICRWDDDDISLSHRLSLSRQKLCEKLEWRPNNYWFDEEAAFGVLKEVRNVANDHVMSLWNREVLQRLPWKKYPPGMSIGEDQAFTNALRNAGISLYGETLPVRSIFYLYRWYNDFNNLSARTDPTRYEDIGKKPISHGIYEITPRWRKDHQVRVDFAIKALQTSLSSGYVVL